MLAGLGYVFGGKKWQAVIAAMEHNTPMEIQ
jgi:hypothetical protein